MGHSAPSHLPSSQSQVSAVYYRVIDRTGHQVIVSSLGAQTICNSRSDLHFVPIVKTNMKTRVFSVTAPILWNLVAVRVRSAGNLIIFCYHLKCYLFNLVYTS